MLHKFKFLKFLIHKESAVRNILLMQWWGESAVTTPIEVRYIRHYPDELDLKAHQSR